MFELNDNLFYIELLIVIEIYICKGPVLLHLQLAEKKTFLQTLQTSSYLGIFSGCKHTKPFECHLTRLSLNALLRLCGISFLEN